MPKKEKNRNDWTLTLWRYSLCVVIHCVSSFIVWRHRSFIDRCAKCKQRVFTFEKHRFRSENGKIFFLHVLYTVLTLIDASIVNFEVKFSRHRCVLLKKSKLQFLAELFLSSWNFYIDVFLTKPRQIVSITSFVIKCILYMCRIKCTTVY